MAETIEKRAREMMKERTLVLIKPDGLKRGIACQILQRFEQAGLKMVGLKILRADRSRLDGHFPKSEEWIIGMGKKTLETYKEYGLNPFETFGTKDPKALGEIIKQWNYDYLIMGPVIAVVLEGIHAIDTVRKFVGHTLPYRAAPGTIRGDFSINSPDLANIIGSACKNLIHASGNKEEAKQEIACWFSPNEIVSWERTDDFMTFLQGENIKQQQKRKRNKEV